MIRAMRIVNGILLAIWVVGGTANFVKNLGDFWVAAGALVGIALWSAPFYLAWRGLEQNSSAAAVKKARTANIIYLAIVVVVAALSAISTYSDKSVTATDFLTIMVVVLLFGVPSVLNFVALRRRTIEIDQALNFPVLDFDVAVESPKVQAPVVQAPSLSSNYFLRHWRGDLSLALSFWINAGLLVNGISVSLFLALGAFADEWPLRTLALVFVPSLIFCLLAWIWGVIGVWRSAEKHVSRGGRSGYSTLAKVVVVLGVISTSGQFVTIYLPMFQTFGPLMFGHDPMGEYQATVLADGRSILVRGILREGSAEGIRKIIDAAPAVTTLVLDSNGGRLAEGKRLAELVYQRKLNTYVEGACVSACTFVFLAGIERAATPNAKVGFHLPNTPWANRGSPDDGSDYMVAVYKRAGLPETFIQRVKATPHSTMWYPTREELIAARVITRVSFGGETGLTFTKYRSKQELALAFRGMPLWAAIEKRFPRTFLVAVDRTWSAREAGGNDAQLMAASRSVMGDVWKELRAQGGDAFLERVTALVLRQAKAARDLSYEACTLYLAGQLDITSTLPQVHTENEAALLREGLASEPRLPTRHDPDLVARALREVSSRMSPRLLDVMVNPGSYGNQPELRCNAFIALYEQALSLPPTLRVAALSQLSQQ